MAVPLWTGIGTEACVCVYAVGLKTRATQRTVMTRTPARDGFFILARSSLRWFLWPTGEACASTKSEPGAGLLGLSYAAQWHVKWGPAVLGFAEPFSSAQLVLVHGRGMDRLDALLDLRGLVGMTESAEGGGLSGQCRDDDGIVRTELFFQDSEELTLAGRGFVCLTQLIVDAAQNRQIRQSFCAIGAVERLINFDGAEHERFRFRKIVLNKVGSCQRAQASGHAGAVFAVGLLIQLESVVEVTLRGNSVVLICGHHAEILKRLAEHG